MLEHLDEQARRAIAEAHRLAHASGVQATGSEHIMLAVLSADTPTLAQLFRQLDVPLGHVISEIRSLVGNPSIQRDTVGAKFTKGGRNLIEAAIRESLQARHPSAGLGHLVLAILLVEDDTAPEVFQRSLTELPRRIEQLRDTLAEHYAEADRASVGGASSKAGPVSRLRYSMQPDGSSETHARCSRCNALLGSSAQVEVVRVRNEVFVSGSIEFHVLYCGRCGAAVTAHS